MDKDNNNERVEKPAVTVSTRVPKLSSTHGIVWLATAVVCLLIGIGVGMIIGKNTPMNKLTSQRTANGTMRGNTNGMPGFNSDRYDEERGRQSGSRITGVVTAINGSTLTVAGNGSTYTVATDSNTQWVGASSASVNDTVMIQYSGSGSNLTALSIRVIGASATSSDGNSTSNTVNNT